MTSTSRYFTESRQRLHRGELQLQALLGGGTFGEVHHATLRGCDVAVKVVRRFDYYDEKEFQHERAVLNALKPHRNIVSYFGCDCPVDPTAHCSVFLFEFAALGSLDYFTARCGGRLDGDHGWEIYQQVLQGLAHIHSIGIWHRDIKPANILMKTSRQPMIADFGISHVDKTNVNPLFERPIGSRAYIPPEFFAEGRFSAVDGDLWAAAVTFVWICTGGRPWNEARKQDKRYEAFSRGELPSSWSNLGAFAPRVIGLLRHDPQRRTIPLEYVFSKLK